MTKTYTGRGDSGETDLLGGKRVAKDDPRIVALGEVDELNAVIGVAMGHMQDAGILEVLHRVQNDLFTLGADLSIAPGKKLNLPRIGKDHVAALEGDISRFDTRRTEKFVLPGGTLGVAHLQLARAVARRAERAVVSLSQRQKVSPFVLEYLNRLSSALFVLALGLKKSGGMMEEHPTYR